MLQRGCDLTSTLCKYDLIKGDLFVLSWARMRRVRQENVSSELLMCPGGVRSILLLYLVARCLETIDRILAYLHVQYVCVVCKFEVKCGSLIYVLLSPWAQ